MRILLYVLPFNRGNIEVSLADKKQDPLSLFTLPEHVKEFRNAIRNAHERIPYSTFAQQKRAFGVKPNLFKRSKA